MMRGFLIIVVVLLCNTGAFGQIRANNSVQDLGDIFENSGKVTVKFQLQNPYREDTIRIVDIETSCGCTAILTQDTIILPQSSIYLDVAYDPSGRLGLFVKSIALTTRTGKDEYNKLYLKLQGNVVAENYTVSNVNRELIEYQVAPIYFFPITVYDTSFLDFNYITSFVNDLTYEVDFYQFATLGVAVKVPDMSGIEKMERLIYHAQEKIVLEFEKRGFSTDNIFFDEPIFTLSDSLPVWSAGQIRLYSVNFDAEELAESSIQVNSNEEIKQSKMLLDYERFALPEIDEIIEELNIESIESKLFLNGEIDLEGTLYMPWKKSDKVREATAKKLKKAIQKKINSTTGATKKEVRISLDATGINKLDKFRFVLWDKSDQEEREKLKYEIKEEEIIPPLLPTYRQLIGNELQIDTVSRGFIHFWENLTRNALAGFDVQLIIETSSEYSFDGTSADGKAKAIAWSNVLEKELKRMFKSATGTDLNVIKKSYQHGPKFDLEERQETFDFKQFNYFTFIPLVHNQPKNVVANSSPYMVNFDYFFKGIDTGAWGFQRFANYLCAMIEKQGYVELRMESSISRIPIEKYSSNLFLAYTRLYESEKRLNTALAFRLVDPNRILISDELVVEQGPIYDGTVPILQYRKFHYIRIIPENNLKN